MRPQPLIAVTDVEASSRFYQRLLGARSAHGGKEYERLVDAQDAIILQLHNLETEHHHGPIADVGQPFGNGLLLWFELDDFDAAMDRVAALDPPLVMPRHRNPNAEHWEIWLRDPDG